MTANSFSDDMTTFRTDPACCQDIFFPDIDMILRLSHVIEQKFQNNCAAETSPFYFEIRETHRQVDVLNIVCADKTGISHCLRKQISFRCAGRFAVMIRAVFPEIPAADIFVAELPVSAIEPAAFVA